MTIPTLYELYVPILELLSDGAPHTRREIVDNLSDHFKLSDVERNPMTDGSGQSSMYSRTSVALTGLRDAGLIASVQWGAYRITELGQSVRSHGQERVERVVKARRPREAGVKQQRAPARHIQYDLNGSPEKQRNSQPGREQPSRVAVFEEILREAGGPLHYSDIHRKAVERLGEEHPKRITYASMYASNRFRLIGKGLFDLPEWDGESSNGDKGDASLWRCPTPLLPVAADSRGYFESIIVGRNLLSANEGMTAEQFYVQMCRWADRPMGSRDEVQSAFDAWYVAGLLPRIDYAAQSDSAVELTVAPEATLSEVRSACIRALYERLSYVPELLTAISILPRPTVADIQRVLQGGGNGRAGISQRLDMLVSLGAIRSEGNAWLLTCLGKDALDAHSPVDLGLDERPFVAAGVTESVKLPSSPAVAEANILYVIDEEEPVVEHGTSRAVIQPTAAPPVSPEMETQGAQGESFVAKKVQSPEAAFEISQEEPEAEVISAVARTNPKAQLRLRMKQVLIEAIKLLFPLEETPETIVISHSWRNPTYVGSVAGSPNAWRGWSANLGRLDRSYSAIYIDYVENSLPLVECESLFGEQFAHATARMSSYIVAYVGGMSCQHAQLITANGFVVRMAGKSVHACLVVGNDTFHNQSAEHWAFYVTRLINLRKSLVHWDRFPAVAYSRELGDERERHDTGSPYTLVQDRDSHRGILQRLIAVLRPGV